jgi:outer membrane receptor for ferrienterochelin and colicins
MNQRKSFSRWIIGTISLLPANTRWFLCLLAFSLALNSPAADTNTQAGVADLTAIPLEQLMNLEVPKVYAASKFEQKTTEAPSSVTVITSDDIKHYGYRTLADVLRSVQGFYVSYDRNYAFLGTRGFNLGDFNSRILLLVDGHRLNNNITDGAYIDTAFILDVDLIDHVEIIRGPGSALYGNNAFFAVINVVTRQPEQMNGAETSGEYGQDATYKGRFSYGKSFTNGFRMMLSGTLDHSDGAENLKFTELGETPPSTFTAHNLDGDEYQSFFGSVGYKDLTLEGAFINRQKENPTAQFLTIPGDPRLRTIDDRSYADLKYAHSFPDIVDVTAKIYYDRSDFQIGYPQPGIFSEEHDVGQWFGIELQVNKRLWDRHMITAGAEYRDDFRQERQVFEPGTPGFLVNDSQSRQSHGVFVQGDFMVLTNLHFNGGVRYDQYGSFDPAFNPRLALIYNPIESATLKAIYGTAFRAPNFLELSDGLSPDIQPEEITSYELVYEQQWGKHVRSSLSGFYNHMTDLIVFEDGGFTNFNANAKGVELAVECGWASVRARASYTLQNTDNRTTGENLSDSPDQLIKANVSVPVYQDKIFASLEFQYTSSRHTEFATSSGETLSGPDAGDFGVLNFTLFSQKLVKNLECSASVYNLLNNHYDDPATRFHQEAVLPQDGRGFRLKLTYRF